MPSQQQQGRATRTLDRSTTDQVQERTGSLKRGRNFEEGSSGDDKGDSEEGETGQEDEEEDFKLDSEEANDSDETTGENSDANDGSDMFNDSFESYGDVTIVARSRHPNGKPSLKEIFDYCPPSYTQNDKLVFGSVVSALAGGCKLKVPTGFTKTRPNHFYQDVLCFNIANSPAMDPYFSGERGKMRILVGDANHWGVVHIFRNHSNDLMPLSITKENIV